MTDQKTFKARYEVDDGYVGNRPQSFTIYASELEDDMTDGHLESMYEDLCDEHMREKSLAHRSALTSLSSGQRRRSQHAHRGRSDE